MIVGFLGAPDQNDIVRIYLDLSLLAYFEIPKCRVLYVEEFDPSDETRPTKIVVAADGPLKLVQTVEASFIRGSIVSANPIGSPVAAGVLGMAPGRVPEIGFSPCVQPTTRFDQLSIIPPVNSPPPKTTAP